ncbi:MAG: tetratricopeptide repeat protein [Gemmataceae bacterium]
MSFAHQTEGPSTKGLGQYVVYLGIAGVVGLVIFLGIWISGKGVTETVTIKSTSTNRDILESVRDSLSKDTSLPTCRNARGLLNSYLEAEFKRKPDLIPVLESDQAKSYSDSLRLDAGEMQEIQSRIFTPLDDHYLDVCFLMRDAAAGLEIENLPPAEQAQAAFAWTVRQVNLREPKALPNPDSRVFAQPPEFVLRRGWGSSLERSLVFLEILRQLGIEGCLVAQPSLNKQPWACAVLVIQEDKKPELLLFDPRLGIALPAQDGKGIATLQAASGEPAVLEQLTVNKSNSYDVTSNEAAASELLLVPPLGSLSPRMVVLQDQFLGSSLHVNLTVNASETLGHFEKAVDKKWPVRFYHDLVVLSRNFLPPEEGGVDTTHAEDIAKLAIVVQNLSLPRFIQDPDLPRPIRKQFTDQYAMPFLLFWLQPGYPRDDVIRGKLGKASSSLVARLDELKDQKTFWQNNRREIEGFLKEWREPFLAAMSQMQRNPSDMTAKEAFEKLREEGGKQLRIMFAGESADHLMAESTYLMASCMQEKAEFRQRRLSRVTRSGKESGEELNTTKDMWADALNWWQTYLDKFDGDSSIPWAKLHKARCLEAMGDVARARTIYETAGDPLSPLEQLANRYRAKKLKQQ